MDKILLAKMKNIQVGAIPPVVSETLATHTSELADIVYSVKDKTTTQIQQFIDDNHLKGVIYFPNTTTNIYVLTDTLKIPSNTTILINEGVILKLDNAINKPIFENVDKINGNTNIIIKGGKLDMNIANQTIQTPCISISKVTKSHFKNIEIMGTKQVTYVGIGAFDLYRCDYNIIENCKLYNSGDEGLYLRECNFNKVIAGEYYDCLNGSGVASTLGQYNEFNGIHCYRNSGSNFSINSLYSLVLNCLSDGGMGFNGITLGHANSPSSYSTVINCIVKNNKQGIRILGSSIGVIVSNNIVADNNFDSTCIGIGVSDSCSNCIVSDNYILNNYLGIQVNTGDKGNIIKNNIVKFNKGTGITITDTRNTIISGNLCENNASLPGLGYGIYLSATSRDNIITENRCFDSQTTKTQERGIYSDGSFNIIANNILFGNKTAQLTNGANCSLSNNILSNIDSMKFDVTLNDTTTTTIVNANINALTKISFIAKTSTALDRKIYQSAITNGSVTFTHLTGTNDIISVCIC